MSISAFLPIFVFSTPLTLHHTMEIPMLLVIFLFLYILISFPNLLRQLIQSIFRLVVRIHFTWRWCSSFSGTDIESTACIAPEIIEELSMSHFKHTGGGPDEQVDCVICLSTIEEGDEIRELRCVHLFHRACLDQWLGYRHVSCPICWIPLQRKKESMVEEKEDELEDLVSLYSSYFGSIFHTVY